MKRNKDIQAQEKARSHGYYWPYRQWGLAVITNPVEKITLPLTRTMLIGIAGDGGNGNNSAGFNSSLYIYTTANVYPTGIAFIAICK